MNVSAKTKLVAWVVSNWRADSVRVQYYQKLQPHLQMDVYGRSHVPLPQEVMTERLSQYKFYLAFENSLHPDYYHGEAVEERPAGLGRASGAGPQQEEL